MATQEECESDIDYRDGVTNVKSDEELVSLLPKKPKAPAKKAGRYRKGKGKAKGKEKEPEEEEDEVEIVRPDGATEEVKEEVREDVLDEKTDEATVADCTHRPSITFDLPSSAERKQLTVSRDSSEPLRTIEIPDDDNVDLTHNYVPEFRLFEAVKARDAVWSSTMKQHTNAAWEQGVAIGVILSGLSSIIAGTALFFMC